MRDESYYMLELPTLNRVVMVCDQVGNATFVFDLAKLLEQDITPQNLIDLSKVEFQSLITNHKQLGAKLVRSDSYVEDVVSLLDEIPEDTSGSKGSTRTVEILRPSETLTATAVAKRVNEEYGSNVSHKTIYKIAETLSEDGLIEIKYYPFRKGSIAEYTTDNYAMMVTRLKEMDILHPVAPEGTTSLSALVGSALRLGHPEYKEVFEKVKIQAEALFGSLSKYRFMTASSFGITEQQLPDVRAIIELNVEHLRVRTVANRAIKEAAAQERKVKQRPEQHPEGYKTLKQMSEHHGVSQKISDKALANVLDQLGEIKQYTHGPRGFRSFSPEQQAILSPEIDRLKTSERTPGRLSANEIARLLNIKGSIARAILKEKATPYLIEKVSQRPSPTYDSSVLEELAADPRVIRLSSMIPAPEGFASLSAFSREHHMRTETARKIIESYHMPVGEFGFGSRSKPATGLRPEDQDFIKYTLDIKAESEEKF